MQITKLKKTVIKYLEKKFVSLEKRLRFVISSLFMSGVLLISTFFFFDKSWLFMPILIVFAYLTTYFAILEGIEGIEWLMLFIMPVLLTVAFYLFYFLFPGRWITRLPFITLYGISYYAILLCSNIFNVGVEKNLALYRAAFSVNFFFQAFMAFLLFSNFLSQRFSFITNGILVGIMGFILSLQLLWSVKLDLQLSRINLFYAALIAVVELELSVIFSFVPQTSTILALFLSASYYSLAGLIFHFLDSRLFKETIREYLTVWIFVFAIFILTMSW